MIRSAILISFCSLCLVSLGADLPDDPEELKKELKRKVKIVSVNDDIIRNDADEKIALLKFSTLRDPFCDVVFKMRVTVELTDKEGSIYYAQDMKQHYGSGEWFTGEEQWEFQIPLGNMQRPKLTAYAVQSGILRGGEMIPVAEDLDDVDTAEEIVARARTKLNIKCTLHKIVHYSE